MAHENPSFTTADYLVFMASLLISLAIGVYQWFRSRGRDTKDFLMGGGHMSPIPVSLSFAAGIISAISILGNSAEMFYHGSQLWMNVIGLMIGTVIVLVIVIPVIYPLKLISIYGYLEYRWRSRLVRKIASVLQLLNFSIYMGIALYAPSLAISSVTPIATNTSVLVLGIVCTIYASMGGAKAVVYTDSFQTFVMLAGVIMVIVQGCAEVGGATASWAIDDQNGRISFFNLSMDPLERQTLIGVIFLGISSAFSSGFSQAQFMRWGSVATLSHSYLVIVLGMGGLMGLWSLINYSGLVVYSVYADCDPLTAGYIEKMDQVLMYFVVDKLGYLPGISGLFVAAICSGVLSSVSSNINALSAIMWKDLLEPMNIFSKVNEEKAKNINIFLSVCAGAVAMVVGVLAGSLGSLVQGAYALSGSILGPLNGIFLTSLLCPWVKQLSVVLATLITLAFNMWVVMGSFLYAPAPEMLPLSVEGCLDPGFNSSTTIASTTTDMSISTSDCTTPGNNGVDDVFPLYKLSYCLYGVIGASSTIVLSTLLSFFIGFESPSNVRASYVNRKCFRFYCWLRREEESTHISEATNPYEANPDDVKSTTNDQGGSSEPQNDPEIIMKPLTPNSDTPGCENPLPVSDFM